VLELGKFHCDYSVVDGQGERTVLSFFSSLLPIVSCCVSLFQPQPSSGKPKDKLNDSLKACNEILKELFSKKHSVSVLFCVQYG
jgi:hypothetical protein